MKKFIEKIKASERVLYITGLIHLLLAALFVILILIDGRSVNHESVWMKPFRFAISIFLFTWTYAWISQFYTHKRLASLLNYLIAGCMFIEIWLIGIQAFRGVPSHFNVSTSFDATVFSIMGAVIGFNAVIIGVHLVLFTFFEMDGGKYRTAIIWGMILFLLGNFTGYLMIQNIGSVTVENAAKTGWFITNWSPSSGDFRIAHFLGLHGIQILPVSAFIINKFEKDPRMIHIGGFIYICILIYCMGYPLTGQ